MYVTFIHKDRFLHVFAHDLEPVREFAHYFGLDHFVGGHGDEIQGLNFTKLGTKIFYWVSIQIASGMSALCGLYATVIFSLTILYGKSALGAERDREYDKFLRRTVRSRVNGARCFTLSLALFALTTVLVLIEKTFLCGSSLPVSLAAFTILYRLYKDWKELSRGRDQIFRDQT